MRPGSGAAGRARSRCCFEEATADGNLINPFYLSMLGAMVRKCADSGYDLLISFQQLSTDWHVDYADTHKADGIILLGYGEYLQSEPVLKRLVDRGTHFVRWGSTGGTQLGATVGSDNEQGGFDATEHLLQSGRRQIAFLGTSQPASRNSTTAGGAIAARFARPGSSRRSAFASMRIRANRPARRDRRTRHSAASSSTPYSRPATLPQSAQCTRCRSSAE